MRRSRIVFPLVAALVAGAASADSIRPFSMQRSPGGISFAYRFDDMTPYAAVNFGWQDPYPLSHAGKAGLHQAQGRVMLDAVPGDDSLRERLLDIGANAAFSFSTLEATASVRAPHALLGDALKMSVASLRDDVPSRQIFDRIVQAVKGAEADAFARSEVIAVRALLTSLAPEHPYLPSFAHDRFAGLVPSDITAWRAATLDRGHLRIAISGRLSQIQAGRFIDDAFVGLPEHRAEPSAVRAISLAQVVKAKTIIVERPTKQSVIMVGGLYPREVGPKLEVAAIGNAVLGGGSTGRLYKAIRSELGAAYGATSGLYLLDLKLGVLQMTATVDTAKLAQSLSLMRKTYAEWIRGSCSAAEVAAAVTAARDRHANSEASPQSANAYILNALLKERSIAEADGYEDRLRQMTQSDVNAAIVSIFPRPEAMITVVVTPTATPLRDAGIAVDCTIPSLDELPRCR